MVQFGGGKINSHPCTEAEEFRNWQEVKNFIEIVNNFLDDSFKVATDATDLTDENYDFLYPKHYNQLAFDDELHQPVYAEVIDDGGNRKLNLFTMITGEGGVSDTYKFKASTSDTDPDFYIESMVYADTYDAGTDIPVYAAAEDQGGGAELIRLFTRVDATFLTLLTDNFTEQFYDDFYTNSNINYFGLWYDDSTHTFGLNYCLVKALVNGAATAQATTFNVDAVEPLFGSRDPGATIAGVVKTQKEALADNTPVTLVYNAEGTPQWELLIVERKRMLRGLTTAAVLANATSFTIDNVVLLSSGIDPRTDPTSTSETVTVAKRAAYQVWMEDNTPVTVVEKGGGWEILETERYRMIRGEAKTAVTTSDATFTIDKVEVLESGRDPRTDPTSETEEITINNTLDLVCSENAVVRAVWNAKEQYWEPLPLEDMCAWLAENVTVEAELVDDTLEIRLLCNEVEFTSATVSTTDCPTPP